MAVLAEAISVIIRLDRLLETYPGGWEQFKRMVPNQTLVVDNELVRVGFMVPGDVEAFISQLERNGLVYLREGEAIDIAVADQQQGFVAPCSWAEFGQTNLDGDPSQRVGACRLIGSRHSTLMTPEGWVYEESLSGTFGFVPTDQRDSIDVVDGENGLEVLRTPLSDKPMYVGRTSDADHFPDSVPNRKPSFLSRLWGRS